MTNVRALVGALLGLLPASRGKNWLMSLVPGWDVHPTATIAPILVRGVRSLTIGARARVGLLTSFQNVQTVRLGDDSIIGRTNWISASPMFAQSDTDNPLGGSLELGDHAAITGRHHLDCSGGIHIGTLTVIGGHATTMLTHAVDVVDSVQRAAAIRIGAACFVSTNCVILPGITVADRIVVGAGSVVVRDLTECETLYAGSPATRKRSLAGAAFFARTTGPVWPHGYPTDAAARRL